MRAIEKHFQDNLKYNVWKGYFFDNKDMEDNYLKVVSKQEKKSFLIISFLFFSFCVYMIYTVLSYHKDSDLSRTFISGWVIIIICDLILTLVYYLNIRGFMYNKTPVNKVIKPLKLLFMFLAYVQMLVQSSLKPNIYVFSTSELLLSAQAFIFIIFHLSYFVLINCNRVLNLCHFSLKIVSQVLVIYLNDLNWVLFIPIFLITFVYFVTYFLNEELELASRNRYKGTLLNKIKSDYYSEMVNSLDYSVFSLKGENIIYSNTTFENIVTEYKNNAIDNYEFKSLNKSKTNTNNINSNVNTNINNNDINNINDNNNLNDNLKSINTKSNNINSDSQYKKNSKSTIRIKAKSKSTDFKEDNFKNNLKLIAQKLFNKADTKESEKKESMLKEKESSNYINDDNYEITIKQTNNQSNSKDKIISNSNNIQSIELKNNTKSIHNSPNSNDNNTKKFDNISTFHIIKASPQKLQSSTQHTRKLSLNNNESTIHLKSKNNFNNILDLNDEEEQINHTDVNEGNEDNKANNLLRILNTEENILLTNSNNDNNYNNDNNEKNKNQDNNNNHNHLTSNCSDPPNCLYKQNDLYKIIDTQEVLNSNKESNNKNNKISINSLIINENNNVFTNEKAIINSPFKFFLYCFTSEDTKETFFEALKKIYFNSNDNHTSYCFPKADEIQYMNNLNNLNDNNNFSFFRSSHQNKNSTKSSLSDYSLVFNKDQNKKSRFYYNDKKKQITFQKLGLFSNKEYILQNKNKLKKENNRENNNKEIQELKELSVIISYRKFLLPNNEIIFDFVFSNITEIKKAETLASEARLKQNIFGKIAHEFKTPLISLTSMIETMNGNIINRDYDKAIDISKNISNIGQYTIFLIDDIIHYCYSGDDSNNSNSNIPIAKEKINLICLLNFCFEILACLIKYGTGKKTNIFPQFKVTEEVRKIEIYSDPLRLKQVLLNLLSNAVKFTKRGFILIAARVINKNVYIYIKDTGIGMKKEVLSKIMSSEEHREINLNLNKEYNNSFGTGLGINIAKNLCKLLGHNIKCQSAENKGTCYELEINSYSYKSQEDIEKEKIEIEVDENIRRKKKLMEENKRRSYYNDNSINNEDYDYSSDEENEDDYSEKDSDGYDSCINDTNISKGNKYKDNCNIDAKKIGNDKVTKKNKINRLFSTEDYNNKKENNVVILNKENLKSSISNNSNNSNNSNISNTKHIIDPLSHSIIDFEEIRQCNAHSNNSYIRNSEQSNIFYNNNTNASKNNNYTTDDDKDINNKNNLIKTNSLNIFKDDISPIITPISIANFNNSPSLSNFKHYSDKARNNANNFLLLNKEIINHDIDYNIDNKQISNTFFVDKSSYSSKSSPVRKDHKQNRNNNSINSNNSIIYYYSNSNENNNNIDNYNNNILYKTKHKTSSTFNVNRNKYSSSKHNIKANLDLRAYRKMLKSVKSSISMSNNNNESPHTHINNYTSNININSNNNYSKIPSINSINHSCNFNINNLNNYNNIIIGNNISKQESSKNINNSSSIDLSKLIRVDLNVEETNAIISKIINNNINHSNHGHHNDHMNSNKSIYTMLEHNTNNQAHTTNINHDDKNRKRHTKRRKRNKIRNNKISNGISGNNTQDNHYNNKITSSISNKDDYFSNIMNINTNNIANNSNIININKGNKHQLNPQSNLLSYSNNSNKKQLFNNACNKNIIIVADDSELLRNSLKQLLNSIPTLKEKYELLDCSDGVEIMNCIIEDQHLGNRIKAVFTDENMEFMNGSKAVSFLKELQSANRIMPCIYFSITAFGDEEHLKSIQKSGFDLVLTKPLSKKKIMDVIIKYELLVDK